jgi:hypothetical protein
MKLQRRPVSDPHVIRPETAIASCVKHMLHSRAPAYRESEEIAGPRELPDRRFSLHKIPQFPTVIAAMNRPFVLCGEEHFRGLFGNHKRSAKRREINPRRRSAQKEARHFALQNCGVEQRRTCKKSGPRTSANGRPCPEESSQTKATEDVHDSRQR